MANNRIQIKRSTSNATVTGLANGELAFTQASNTLHIGLPDGSGVLRIGGAQYPGTLTNSHALVANATGHLDIVKAANVEVERIIANSSAGDSGYVLFSGGAGSNSYWAPSGAISVNTNSQYVWSNVITHNANLVVNTGATFIVGNGSVNTVINSSSVTTDLVLANLSGTYVNVSGQVNTSTLYVSTSANLTSATLANSSGLYTTGTVNAATFSVGSNFIANSSQVTIGTGTAVSANGTTGTAGQVLTSNGTTVYWSEPAGDIKSVTAGNGLSGGGSSGDVTLDVGAGDGISVNSDFVSVLANNGIVANSTGVFVKANNGIVANSTGVFAQAANGISVDSSGINVSAANGIAVGSGGVRVTGANGISVTSSGVNVTAGDGAITNSSGVHVLANNGIVANASGVFVSGANGISVDGNGVNVLAGNGIISNSTGIFAKAGNGVSVDTNGINVTVANGLVSNTSGIFVATGSTLTQNSSGLHVNNTLSITDLTLSGNLTVSGSLTTVNTNTLVVKDAIIRVASNNQTTDTIDFGFYGSYGNTTDTRYSGFVRKHDESVMDGATYVLFSSNTEPTSTVDINAPNFTVGTLRAYLNAGGLVSNSSNVQITANGSVGVNIVANTLTLSSPLAGNSGGTGKSTVTNNALLVGNSTNGYNELTLGTSGYVLQSNGTALVYDTLDGGTF